MYPTENINKPWKLRQKEFEKVLTHMSYACPLSPIRVFSAMYTFAKAKEKANVATTNCPSTMRMSLRMSNKAIWMVPTCFDCSMTWPKALNVRHKVLKPYKKLATKRARSSTTRADHVATYILSMNITKYTSRLAKSSLFQQSLSGKQNNSYYKSINWINPANCQSVDQEVILQSHMNAFSHPVTALHYHSEMLNQTNLIQRTSLIKYMANKIGIGLGGRGYN